MIYKFIDKVTFILKVNLLKLIKAVNTEQLRNVLVFNIYLYYTRKKNVCTLKPILRTNIKSKYVFINWTTFSEQKYFLHLHL